MPIPEPTDKETKKEFSDRCMIDPTMVAEYDEKQRYAICESQLEQKEKTMGEIKKRNIISIEED